MESQTPSLNSYYSTLHQTLPFNRSQPPVGFPVTFNASNTRIYQSPTPTSTRFLWSFADGTNGTGILAAHKYVAPAFYRVILTVVTSQGSPGISKTLNVTTALQGYQYVHALFHYVNITS